MKKTALLLAAMLLAMLLASGAALAANQIDCSDNPGVLCLGTPRSDEIKGTGTHDDIRALAGSDVVNAGGGNDSVHGRGGADRLRAGQCSTDRMYGGHGADTINVSDRTCSFIQITGGPGPEDVSDKADCGAGFDVVRGVDRYDRINADCERIVRE
jgi:Ca2+-binding RTX toxin-like protein